MTAIPKRENVGNSPSLSFPIALVSAAKRNEEPIATLWVWIRWHDAIRKPASKFQSTSFAECRSSEGPCGASKPAQFHSSIPTILQSLMGEVSQAPQKVDLNRVVDLIGRDKSIAAQRLRLANSPLMGRGTRTDSVRGAVRTLGISHIRDIAFSTMMMQISGTQKGMDPVVFWEHSLGCAIVSRKLARAVGFEDPERAYLAGLLHDLGYVVNIVLFPQQEKAALETAMQTGEFLGVSEYEKLGFSHCQSGEVLGRFWNFSDDLIEVILCHHNASAAVISPGLVAIVSLSDRPCRSHSLGVGAKKPTILRSSGNPIGKFWLRERRTPRRCSRATS